MTPGTAVADLSRVLVADEIGRVRNERWSEVLAMSQGEVSKGLYFLEGDIVFAASTVEEDRLGACLFRAGKITEGQFRAAMRESESSHQPLGHTFVEMGSSGSRPRANRSSRCRCWRAGPSARA